MSLEDLNQFLTDSEDDNESTSPSEPNETDIQTDTIPTETIPTETIPEPSKPKRKYTKKTKENKPTEPKVTKKQQKMERQHQRELELLKEQANLLKLKNTVANPVTIAENAGTALVKKFKTDVNRILTAYSKNSDKKQLISKYNSLRSSFDVDFDNIIQAVPENFKIPNRLYDKIDDCLENTLNRVRSKLD